MPQHETRISAEAIVEIVSEARRRGEPVEQTTAKLIETGLSRGEVADAYHMLACGYSRAMVASTGAIATADYDDDPVFQAALKRAQRELFPSRRVARQKVIIVVAIIIAILIGLFASVAVVYAAFSWLQELH
jgi:hypothetical protein